MKFASSSSAPTEVTKTEEGYCLKFENGAVVNSYGCRPGSVYYWEPDPKDPKREIRIDIPGSWFCILPYEEAKKMRKDLDPSKLPALGLTGLKKPATRPSGK